MPAPRLPTTVAIIAQSYYQLKDCKNASVWADKAIAATRKAGETPKENLYLFKLQCASDAGDTRGHGRGADGSDPPDQQDRRIGTRCCASSARMSATITIP